MFKKIVSGLEQAHLKSLAAKGGLSCPACGTVMHQLPAEMDAIVTCLSCGHFGSASEWARGNTDGNRVGRADQPPAGTRIVREKAGSFTTWHIPPSGNGGGLVGFGWVWTIFIAIFTFAATTPLWLTKITPDAKVQVKGASGAGGTLAMLGFLSIFWAVGLAMLYFGYRMKNAKHRVTIGNGAVTLLRDWSGRKKEKSLPLAGLQSISQVVFYSRNYQPVHGVELKGSSGKLRFGSGLTPEEKAWLVADFKAAVWPQSQAGLQNTGARQASGQPQGIFSVALPGSAAGGLIFGVLFALIGGTFVGIGLLMMSGSHGSSPGFFETVDAGFRGIWITMSSVFFVIGCIVTVMSARKLGIETRIEGTTRHIAVRKMKKGLVLEEKLFDRAQVRDIRASETGQMNGKPMKKVELIVGQKAERIALWVDGEKADAAVDEVRRALG
ncbi:hypothetical protein KBB96_18410 [Luteolibacter ambystomatis]|uniref:Uncharacterized protein n=2 Tax=Luteolibacter ambystomatis TaxID=2824561 RepID=A0A975IZ51_9BACT|nr:hypothetical protein [Luteolibacter ambystomatis]QUE50819.1 hypothetical protein KBB96_18410 [Luteolibacter ambystomatis]